MKINLNERIEFIPTEEGRAIIKNDPTSFTFTGVAYTCQLWEFLHVFGPHIVFGAPCPVEGADIKLLTQRNRSDSKEQEEEHARAVAESEARSVQTKQVLDDAMKLIDILRRIQPGERDELVKLRGYYAAIVKELGNDDAIGTLRLLKRRLELVCQAVDLGRSLRISENKTTLHS